MKTMSKDEAQSWAKNMIENGTFDERELYRRKKGVGMLAEDLWHDATFTYGMEYGILLAIARIYGELDK